MAYRQPIGEHLQGAWKTDRAQNGIVRSQGPVRAEERHQDRARVTFVWKTGPKGLGSVGKVRLYGDLLEKPTGHAWMMSRRLAHLDYA